MKHRILFFFALLCLWVGQILAQENTAAQESISLTPAQQEEVRLIAMDIDASCTLPTRPAIPDGNGTTEDEMLTAQNALKAFIDDGNNYLGCLEELENSFDDITATQSAMVSTLYNQVVDGLQSSADEFNAAVRAFKANSSD